MLQNSFAFTCFHHSWRNSEKKCSSVTYLYETTQTWFNLFSLCTSNWQLWRTAILHHIQYVYPKFCIGWKQFLVCSYSNLCYAKLCFFRNELRSSYLLGLIAAGYRRQKNRKQDRQDDSNYYVDQPKIDVSFHASEFVYIYSYGERILLGNKEKSLNKKHLIMLRWKSSNVYTKVILKHVLYHDDSTRF